MTLVMSSSMHIFKWNLTSSMSSFVQIIKKKKKKKNPK